MSQELRSFDEWQRSLRNFEWLGDSLPGAMDVDCLIERRGNFLVIEGKPYVPGSGITVSLGQHIALDALAKQAAFDVWLVGETGDENRVYLVEYGTRQPTKTRRGAWFKARQCRRTTQRGLRELVEGWFEEASCN